MAVETLCIGVYVKTWQPHYGCVQFSRAATRPVWVETRRHTKVTLETRVVRSELLQQVVELPILASSAQDLMDPDSAAGVPLSLAAFVQ